MEITEICAEPIVPSKTGDLLVEIIILQYLMTIFEIVIKDLFEIK